MAAWSPEIANEFIRLAQGEGRALTQMQLQKLVYIAHGWNLAINGEPLTYDAPKAWDYGPVYKELWAALRPFGRSGVSREIRNAEFAPGVFHDHPNEPAKAKLTAAEKGVIGRVYQEYGKFHAFQLSALTHQEGTPWTRVYASGEGKYDDIEPELIKEHFVGLANANQPA